MGRRLSDDRHAALYAVLIKRLPHVAPPGRRAMAQDIAAASGSIAKLLGDDGRVHGQDSRCKALLAAVRELAKVQAGGARAPDGLPSHDDAVAKWIAKYINPASPSALPGADRFWKRGLSHQRDISRRARLKDSSRSSQPRLSARHRRMLDEIARSMPGKSAGDVLGMLIKARHQKLARKSRSESTVQPTLKLF